MRRGAWSSALVLVIVTVLAAVCQLSIPPIGIVRAKLPLLLSVTIYYAMRRETEWGFAAALLSGILEDGLAVAPSFGLSPLLFVGAFAGCKWWLRPQLPDKAYSCAMSGAVFSSFCILLQYISLRLFSGYAALPAWFLATRLASGAVLGAVSALIVAHAAWALDWLSANVGLEDERETLGWDAD